MKKGVKGHLLSLINLFKKLKNNFMLVGIQGCPEMSQTVLCENTRRLCFQELCEYWGAKTCWQTITKNWATAEQAFLVCYKYQGDWRWNMDVYHITKNNSDILVLYTFTISEEIQSFTISMENHGRERGYFSLTFYLQETLYILLLIVRPWRNCCVDWYETNGYECWC